MYLCTYVYMHVYIYIYIDFIHLFILMYSSIPQRGVPALRAHAATRGAAAYAQSALTLIMFDNNNEK